MSDVLYNREILRLAASIPLCIRLENPQITVTKTSPVCGSRIIIDLDLKDGKISAFGQEVRACALGQASASLMGRMIVGREVGELQRLRTRMEDFLKYEGSAPTDDWQAFEIFAPARAHKSRHGSIMLPFDAVAEAIKRLQKAVPSSDIA